MGKTIGLFVFLLVVGAGCWLTLNRRNTAGTAAASQPADTVPAPGGSTPTAATANTSQPGPAPNEFVAGLFAGVSPASQPAGAADIGGIARIVARQLGRTSPADVAAIVKQLSARPWLGRAITIQRNDGATVAGGLVDASAQHVVIISGDKLVSMNWSDATAASAVGAMRVILDPVTPAKQLSLGQYLLGRDEPRLAVAELTAAVNRDASLTPQAEELVATWKQNYEQRLAASVATQHVAPVTPGGARQGVVRYPAPGSQDPAPLIAATDAEAREVGRRINVRFDRTETAHYLIYHTWGRQPRINLANSLESMYVNVATLCGALPAQNLFAGKCPVYVAANFQQFQQLCKPYGITPTRDVLGLTLKSSDGSVRMFMYWNDNERQFLATLAHEGTHAIMHRYRTSADLPVWIDEGFAEYVSALMYPQNGKAETARLFAWICARQNKPLAPLFAAQESPPGDYYPVCLSLVTYMIKTNPAAFGSLMAQLKEGDSIEVALQQSFHNTLAQLETAWKASVTNAGM